MKYPLSSLLSCLVLKKKSQGSEFPEDICRQFSLAEIKAATNNFHPDSIIMSCDETRYFLSCDNFQLDSIIGEGGFGTVYKGTIDDGTIVAVKRCRRGPSQGVTAFQNEVQLLCQLRHPHLVSLIGFCLAQNKMFVVLEYMSRGSLHAFLCRKDYVPLAWKHRLQICIGAARGLHYLHTGAKRAVIHRNIKSSNILLDDECSCKLSDFGLSKLGPRSMSKALIRMDTRIMGTIGYMAPEYALYGELTEKSDVYSFGVVLFEVICGRTVRDFFHKHQQDMLDCVSEFVKEGSIYHVVDPYLKGGIAPECLKKYVEIACSCVHHYKGNERPAMGEVEVALELALELQEKADSEMEGINPIPYGECIYEEASVSASVCNFLGLYCNSYGNVSGYNSSESDSNNSNNNS